MKKKIVITGGTGRFGNILKNKFVGKEIYFPTKKELNILDEKIIDKYLKKIRPKFLIHLAGLSRPMKVHKKNISKSIDLNIIGTANITKVCEKYNIKLIYFSTHYVYPGTKGNYLEQDPLQPINNYAWSKLGGEASVHMYKNSLILRVCMTEKPFIHKEAFTNVKTSFIYQEEVARFLPRLLKEKGILNLGGKPQFVYDFAKKTSKNIKKKYLKKNSNFEIPLNSSLNVSKLKKILNEKN